MNLSLVETIGVPTTFVTLWLLERRRPARAFAPVANWAASGIGFFVLTATVGSVVSMLWKASPLSQHSLLHLQQWGFASLPIALAVLTLAHYWWHRAEHHFDSLWVRTHQLHHSVLRVDIAGAFFVHPAEVAAKMTLSFLVLVAVLGVAPEVAVVVTTALAMLSIFEHWNVRTPRWLGYLIQRPEMHCLHHEFQVHRRNYGLPVWDLLFGTFENPTTVDVKVGYEPAASRRIADMLRWRDVNAKP